MRGDDVACSAGGRGSQLDEEAMAISHDASVRNRAGRPPLRSRPGRFLARTGAITCIVRRRRNAELLRSGAACKDWTGTGHNATWCAFSEDAAITEVRAFKSWTAWRKPTSALFKTLVLLSAQALLSALALLTVSVPAEAHRNTPLSSTAGLSIPSVSHGQMQVLEAYRADVMDLAGKQYPTDPDMRRLQTFVALQYFTCAWGLVPGGASNENSPFNECTHAYLAGVRALLLHLETMPGNRSAVRALRGRIDTKMLESHASLVLCRFSDEPFNTADVVTPRWTELLTDSPSLIVLALLALGAAFVGGASSKLIRSLDKLSWRGGPSLSTEPNFDASDPAPALGLARADQELQSTPFWQR